jgi:hypothetical protein
LHGLVIIDAASDNSDEKSFVGSAPHAVLKGQPRNKYYSKIIWKL